MIEGCSSGDNRVASFSLHHGDADRLLVLGLMRVDIMNDE